MNELTRKLQEADSYIKKTGADLSEAAKEAYKYAMRVTAFQKAQPNEQHSAKKEMKQSEKKLSASLKKDPSSKATIANITSQSETAATSTLVEGFKRWTIALLSPEEAFEKIHNPKQ